MQEWNVVIPDCVYCVNVTVSDHGDVYDVYHIMMVQHWCVCLKVIELVIARHSCSTRPFSSSSHPDRFTLVPELHPDWMLLLFFTHTHLTVTVTLGLLLIPKVNVTSRVSHVM